MFVVIATTDGRNVGREIDTLPAVGETIDLDGYMFRVDNVDSIELVISNANYIMRLEKRTE